MGAGTGLIESRTSNEPLRQRIAELEALPNRGLRDTVALGQARMRHTIGEYGSAHPEVSAGVGALTGGMLGMLRGPAWAEKAHEISNLVRQIRE